jgi:hypothetical protein
MNIKKSRIIQIIKEEMRKMAETDWDEMRPLPLIRPGREAPTAATSAEPEPEPQPAEPTIQDLMFKMEKLMTRVAKLESMLKTEPDPEATDDDTAVVDLTPEELKDLTRGIK